MGSVGQYTQGWMPWMAAKATAVSGWARTNDSASLGMGYYTSDGTQNGEFTDDLWLDSVTWKIAVNHYKSTDQGIMTFQFDGVTQGTIDGYTGAPATNNYSEITGISVATASAKTFKVLMATKNASSSSYIARIASIALIRTGGTASTPAGSDTPGYTWQYLPWMGTKGNTAVSTRTQNSGHLGGGYLGSNDANQNDEWNTDVWLDAGTYKCAIEHITNTNNGIYTLNVDASSKGTIDGYAGSSTANNYAEVTGITIASPTAARNFQMKTATKNGSSSGYAHQVQSVAWIRTGA